MGGCRSSHEAEFSSADLSLTVRSGVSEQHYADTRLILFDCTCTHVVKSKWHYLVLHGFKKYLGHCLEAHLSCILMYWLTQVSCPAASEAFYAVRVVKRYGFTSENILTFLWKGLLPLVLHSSLLHGI